MKDADARALLRDLFDAALAAARPATCLAPYIAKLQPPKGRTIVIGAGKASAAMARAVEDQWPHPLEGLVVTRYGYGETCKRIEIVEAAHPVPDEKGRAAAGRILEKVKGLTRRRSGALPHLGRRLVAARAARPRPDAGRQAGGQPRAAEVGRQHRRDEHGAKASLGHQGRPARHRRPAGARAVVADLRRAQRRSRRDRLRARPCADRTTFADALAVLAKYRIDPPPAVLRPSRGGRGRQDRGDAQARRSAARACRDDHRGHAQALARSRRGRRALDAAA